MVLNKDFFSPLVKLASDSTFLPLPRGIRVVEDIPGVYVAQSSGLGLRPFLGGTYGAGAAVVQLELHLGTDVLY